MDERRPVQVEAYAGARYPERPTAVWVDDRRLEVQNVLRQWRTPDALHFRVEVEELGEVELIYAQGVWFLNIKD